MNGGSNMDFKSLRKDEVGRPDTMSQIDFLSLPKMKTINDLMSKRERHIKSAVNPKASTTDFYKQTGKVTREAAELDNARTSHLEEREKRARVYIGESNLVYEPHPENKV